MQKVYFKKTQLEKNGNIYATHYKIEDGEWQFLGNVEYYRYGKWHIDRVNALSHPASETSSIDDKYKKYSFNSIRKAMFQLFAEKFGADKVYRKVIETKDECYLNV